MLVFPTRLSGPEENLAGRPGKTRHSPPSPLEGGVITLTEHHAKSQYIPFFGWDRDRSDPARRKEQNMTVGIAGACVHQGENAIVMVCDWQGTYGHFVKSNDIYKMRHVGERITVLWSDDETEADRLIALMTPVLKAYEASDKPAEDLDIRVSQLIHDLKVPIQQRQAEVTEHFVRMNYGFSYQDFRDHGTKWFRPKQHAKYWKEIRALPLGCDLIICYADDDEPVIIDVNQRGKPTWSSNFATIGSGSDIALASLCQKNYDADTMSLMECLGRIFIAKKMAEKNPYVGDDSAFDVLIKGNENRVLTNNGWAYLRQISDAGSFDPTKLEFAEGYLGLTRHP
jgi:20S proteasome alpha/beta subunit